MTGRYLTLVVAAIVLSFVMLPQRLDAQDSTRLASEARSAADSSMLRVLMTGAQYYHPGNPKEFDAPKWLRVRRRDNRRLKDLWNLDGADIPDLPMSHGAGYMSARFDFRPVGGITASLELVGEHRGISYGVFNTRNLIVYPIYRITADTAIRIDGQRFGVHVDVGHLTDVRLQEGLAIYNVDGEGVDVKIDWKRLTLRHTRIGDLAYGVGLNVDEVYDWSFGVEDIPLFGDARLNAHAGTYAYSTSRNEPASNIPSETPRSRLIESAKLAADGFTADLSLARDSMRIYAQGALRMAFTSDYLSSRTAFVAGLSGSFGIGPVDIAGRGEYRYYGGLFNHGYRSHGVHYRDTAVEDYGNNIGPQLYPIRYYDRPFSQWGVFTEYQSLRAINAVTLQGTASWRFVDEFFLRLMIDANHLMVEGENGYLYFFYDAGIGWEPVPGTSLTLSSTNKVMNLDKHYMTFYQARRPYVMYTLRVAL